MLQRFAALHKGVPGKAPVDKTDAKPGFPRNAPATRRICAANAPLTRHLRTRRAPITRRSRGGDAPLAHRFAPPVRHARIKSAPPARQAGRQRDRQGVARAPTGPDPRCDRTACRTGAGATGWHSSATCRRHAPPPRRCRFRAARRERYAASRESSAHGRAPVGRIGECGRCSWRPSQHGFSNMYPTKCREPPGSSAPSCAMKKAGVSPGLLSLPAPYNREGKLIRRI